MKKSYLFPTFFVFLSTLPATSWALHHARSEKQETEQAVRAVCESYKDFSQIRKTLLLTEAQTQHSPLIFLGPRAYRWINAGFLRVRRSLFIPDTLDAPQNGVLAGHDFPRDFKLADEMARLVDMLDTLTPTEKLLFEEGYNTARRDFLEGFLRYVAGERTDLPS